MARAIAREICEAARATVMGEYCNISAGDGGWLDFLVFFGQLLEGRFEAL